MKCKIIRITETGRIRMTQFLQSAGRPGQVRCGSQTGEVKPLRIVAADDGFLARIQFSAIK